MSIDEFDGETPTAGSPFTLDGSMLGGERDVAMGPTATFGTTGGLATFTSLDDFATVLIYYDGDDNDATLGFGLGGIDLRADGADRFQLLVTSLTAVNPSITLHVWDSPGNGIRTAPVTITSPGVYEFMFSSFSFINGTGASVTNANAIQVVYSDNTGGVTAAGSLTVDYLRTNGDASPVPEPSSVALMGLGLVACGLWRRKRNG